MLSVWDWQWLALLRHAPWNTSDMNVTSHVAIPQGCSHGFHQLHHPLPRGEPLIGPPFQGGRIAGM